MFFTPFLSTVVLSLNARGFIAVWIRVVSFPTDRVETGCINHVLVQKLRLQQCCVELRRFDRLYMQFNILFLVLVGFHFYIVIQHCFLQTSQDWLCLDNFSQCTEYRLYFRSLNIHHAFFLELHRFLLFFLILWSRYFLLQFCHFSKLHTQCLARFCRIIWILSSA